MELVPDTPEHQAGLVRALQQHVTQALPVRQTTVSRVLHATMFVHQALIRIVVFLMQP